jgi:hypothetical protein
MANGQYREITRAYDRRGGGKKGTEAGRAGIVGLRVPTGEWYMTDAEGKFQTIPENMVSILMTQALSPLTDSLSGKHKIADAAASFEKKRSDILAGRYRVRGGAGVDPVWGEMRKLLRISYEEKKPDVWAGVAEEDEDDFLDAAIEKQPAKAREALEARARENVAEADAKREAARQAKAVKLAADAEAVKGLRL